MKVNKLIEIPYEMREESEYLQSNIDAGLLYYALPSSKTFLEVKFFSIAVWLLLKENMQPVDFMFFEMEKQEYVLLKSKETESLDELLEVFYEYKQYVERYMNMLCNFGWEKIDVIGFGNDYADDKPYSGYRETILSEYPEFFDELELQEKEGKYNHTFAHIFQNKRLGQYYLYQSKNKVDHRLKEEIEMAFSSITSYIGIENCLYKEKSGEAQIIYVFSKLEDYEEYEDLTYANTDLLLPVYAYNLEKLLDIAFERYPIESEGLQ